MGMRAGRGSNIEEGGRELINARPTGDAAYRMDVARVRARACTWLVVADLRVVALPRRSGDL